MDPVINISISDFNDHWWREVCKKAKKAVVFIDDNTAESLHWQGGLCRLYRAGVVAVKTFAASMKAEKCQKKALFLLNGAVTNAKADILGQIIRNSSFEYVTLITNVPAVVHNTARFPGRELAERHTLDELEQQILEWMGNFNYTCEVFYFPLVFAPLEELPVFATASFTRLRPLLAPDVDKVRELWTMLNQHHHKEPLQLAKDAIDLSILPLELQVNMLHFVHSLSQLFQMMDAKEDIFSVGAFSDVVAQQLEQLAGAKARRKTASKKLSLILIDRTVDLARPTSCSFRCALDKVFAALPTISGHANDVRIEMAPLFGISTKKTSPEKEVLCGGCLASSTHLRPPDDKTDHGLTLNALLKSDTVDEALLKCHSALKPSKIRPASRVSADVEDAVLAFKGDNEAISRSLDLLQRSLAIVSSSQADQSAHFNTIRNIQGDFLLELKRDKHAVRGYLVKIVRLLRERKSSRGKSVLPLDFVLLILVHIYSLLPRGIEFFLEDEDRLQSVLSETLVDEASPGEIVDSLCQGRKMDDILAHKLVKQIFERLHAVSWTRSQVQYDTLLLPEEAEKKASDYGYLQQLLLDVFAPDRRDIPDLKHHGQGLVGSMLKSGIGFFGMNVSKAHPRENPNLLIFVLGGLTWAEVKDIRALIEQSSTSCKVMLGTTRITSPFDTLRAILSEDILHPE